MAFRGIFQNAAIAVARPYVRRELPGWGKVLSLVAGYQRDWMWQGAPEKIVTGKLHGYKMHLALDGWWADRSTYFLDRWYDLETQLVLRDLVKPGSTVVDVGANRGMFALTASHTVGPTLAVLSVLEPNPKVLCAFTARDRRQRHQKRRD